MKLPSEPSIAEAPRARLGLAELERSLYSLDASVVLAAPRIVRRVIKQHAGIRGLGLRVPHRKSYVIRRAALLAIVELSELDLPPQAHLAEIVILLARPAAEKLTAISPEEAWTKYWRLLFHARVHAALNQGVTAGRLGAAVVRQRVRQIGETEFTEIRAVLKQEDYLLPAREDLDVYIEFAAVYLELRLFAPTFVRDYFPGLRDVHKIDEVLAHDIDAEELFESTRPPDAGPQPWRGNLSHPGHFSDGHAEPALPNSKLSVQAAESLVRQAGRVAALGNLVRAAILRSRAARLVAADEARAYLRDAATDLSRLAYRLQSALGFTAAEAEDWSKSLVAILEQSSRGFWTPEARMLYDLQKVCVDHERGIYALNLWRWIRSLGREPIKRLLPGQRDVLMSKHLRGAGRRLASVRLSGAARSRLAALLQLAIHRAEANLRAHFQPPILAVLDEVGLQPQNLPEQVARKKLVDDALSRNNLKLPDLSSIGEFIWGDQLLQADARLSASLDGVYHRGEIYLRWPQRLSSLAFGTPAGRFLTRYVALPFGSAYLAQKGLQHILAPSVHAEFDLVSAGSLAVVGIFLIGVLHQPQFRRRCMQALRSIGWGLRLLWIELPRRLMRLPAVQKIVNSPAFKLLQRYLFKPLVVSALVAGVMSVMLGRQATLESAAVTFVIVNLLLNSRIGRNVDELVTDWLAHTWHRIRMHVLAALFRLIMDAFNRVLETIERLLYTVDEWLRFKSGESSLSTVCKAVLGMIWMVVNYLIRIYVNLLIEPQINPIKHFPVVTVSHKIMLPFVPRLTGLLAGPFVPFIGLVWANAIAGPTVFLLPGVFGFLVWELKENWRLYAANRPETLQPLLVGHHGETMIQFMRPGFRSGTLPKLYARLRRTSRKALWTGNWHPVEKQRDGLHRVEEHIRRFVDRDLLMMLMESHGWGNPGVTTGEILLGTNRVLVELYCPELGEDSLWLAFEDHSGWLTASVYERGWLDRLEARQTRTLTNALAGFYKLAGVDLVLEQIEARLTPDAPAYEISEAGLLLWRGRGQPPLVYPLRDRADLDGKPPLALDLEPHAVPRELLVFAASPISWRRWIITWEVDLFGGATQQRAIDGLHLLPSESAVS